MKKFFWSFLLVNILFHCVNKNIYAYNVEGLKCDTQVSSGYAPATSYILFRKQESETTYTPVDEQSTCFFPSQVVEDTSETCFKFGSKNQGGVSVRSTIRICVDPRNAPPPQPTSLGLE